MIEAYAVPDVREVEDLARAGLPEGELMKRAARGLAEVVLARLDDDPEGDTAGSVVALVGAGDNGGDALYATMLLAGAGVPVAVVTSGRSDDEAVGLAREAGVVVVSADEEEAVHADHAHHFDDGRGRNDIGWRDLLGEASVVVDGLLGIGGRPGLRAPARTLVDAVPADAWVLAVDLPSGADPAGEQVADDLVVADETVTFSLVKPVHLLPASEPAVGRLTVVDIGLDDALRRSGVHPSVERLTFDDVADLWPVPDASSDKYSRGVVGIVAGSVNYPGAAVLSVLGALGAGPGMVRYLGPRDVRWLVHQAAPEVVTARGRVQAWVIGSGFDASSDQDESDDAREQKERALEALASDLPVLVDAGALDLVDRRDAPTLLTPHAGELARLLTRLEVSVGDGGQVPDGMRGGGVTREQVTSAPLAHARAAARRTGCTVLL
ncbi:MAG: bifunctional ADP-dependent NAD(P)H-hydrate dehydratase/NAD(P)H-hydrate epimerase, partial [Actinomycetota bacterium]|nr:bifunctional ADP-dependent NAD(P)H-hydrate dehydratase/NAD(P)H-hydrate epimerase [Actinomycetota bacterium]